MSLSDEASGVNGRLDQLAGVITTRGDFARPSVRLSARNLSAIGAQWFGVLYRQWFAVHDGVDVVFHVVSFKGWATPFKDSPYFKLRHYRLPCVEIDPCNLTRHLHRVPFQPIPIPEPRPRETGILRPTPFVIYVIRNAIDRTP